ncbi:hypothetical protein V8G54_023024 [Vigna mungo]|uniref:F-box domain-containing protein n=1 Tax=Vigna mungo TaxID=3915 RepID=A0AAQ3N4L6_VIGMU
MANDEMLVFKDVMSPSLRQMNKTFYSNKEIFFHELINNASNALDKIQFERNTHKNISDDRLIRIVPHKANKTLSIIDFGIGLTKEDLAYNFGVGFYSAFLVAHKVIVTSKRNDHDQYIWESQPGAFFIVTKDINAQQPSRGTNITLFLNDNQLDYLEESTIKNLIIKYCQHISHHIYLWNENNKDYWQLINIWFHDQERDNTLLPQRHMNHLPDDLVPSILSKLPLKSLKRFGCVRRSWTLLFENSHFMNLIRNNFIRNHYTYYEDACLVLNLTLVHHRYNSSLFLSSGERFQNMEKLSWPSQIPEDFGQLYILGSSSIHGIFCLHAHYNQQPAILWNPAINEFKVIPPSPFDYVADFMEIVIVYHGFGYDCVRDDYKVIRKVVYAEKTDDDDKLSHDILTVGCVWEMYSLRNNSWTNLQFGVGIPSSSDIKNKFYLEGMCHWWGSEDDFIENLISFDLINNVWIMTPPPLDIPMDAYDNFEMYLVNRELFLLNGSIALMSNYAQTTTFYISILIEVGKKETWTKLFVFGPIPYITFPIGIRNMGNILFQTDDGDLAWFDSSTHILQKLGVNVHGRFCQLVFYKESLIRIERINS